MNSFGEYPSTSLNSTTIGPLVFVAISINLAEPVKRSTSLVKIATTFL